MVGEDIEAVDAAPRGGERGFEALERRHAEIDVVASTAGAGLAGVGAPAHDSVVEHHRLSVARVAGHADPRRGVRAVDVLRGGGVGALLAGRTRGAECCSLPRVWVAESGDEVAADAAAPAARPLRLLRRRPAVDRENLRFEKGGDDDEVGLLVVIDGVGVEHLRLDRGVLAPLPVVRDVHLFGVLRHDAVVAEARVELLHAVLRHPPLPHNLAVAIRPARGGKLHDAVVEAIAGVMRTHRTAELARVGQPASLVEVAKRQREDVPGREPARDVVRRKRFALDAAAPHGGSVGRHLAHRVGRHRKHAREAAVLLHVLLGGPHQKEVACGRELGRASDGAILERPAVQHLAVVADEPSAAGALRLHERGGVERPRRVVHRRRGGLFGPLAEPAARSQDQPAEAFVVLGVVRHAERLNLLARHPRARKLPSHARGVLEHLSAPPVRVLVNLKGADRPRERGGGGVTVELLHRRLLQQHWLCVVQIDFGAEARARLGDNAERALVTLLGYGHPRLDNGGIFLGSVEKEEVPAAGDVLRDVLGVAHARRCRPARIRVVRGRVAVAEQKVAALPSHQRRGRCIRREDHERLVRRGRSDHEPPAVTRVVIHRGD
mmetsp:Transcript_7743/g.25703  ORF Transcript_7743/g.25703 Transcript_7743/m.25703 type:complete len:608 (-) Transcript_7743:947-2770(-)